LEEVLMVDKHDIAGALRGKTCYVLFSGGKDSLCALALTKEIGDEVNAPVRAIHVDTTVSPPENLEYAKDVCRRLDIPLGVVSPEEDFFSMAKRFGAPRFNARWCCYALKIKPIRDYLRRKPQGKIVADGIRRGESLKRKRYSWFWYDKKHFKCFVIHPIIDWSEKQVLDFLSKRGLPLNPLYRKFKRAAECWCGVFKSRRDFEVLRAYNPELFRKLLDVERSLKKGSFGKNFYLRDIEKQRMLDEYL